MQIAIVEDHAPPRESLVQALAQVPDWQVLPPCINEEEGRHLLQTQRPDMLLVDLGLPLGIQFHAMPSTSPRQSAGAREHKRWPGP